LSTTALHLDPQVTAALREVMTRVSDNAVDAIMAQVPAYTDAWKGSMGVTIANAVRQALDGFVTIASRSADDVVPRSVAVDGAYALGRGEARSGRSMDALLAAYRIGAKVSWHELSQTAVAAGLGAADLAGFAELVFAYIDELSASSVAGHADELATSGRVRQRYLDHLARQLLAGAATDVLRASAERADWAVPRTLTAVLLPASQARAAVLGLDPRTLQADATVPDHAEGDTAVLLVPDVRSRTGFIRGLADHGAVVGPSRPWEQVRSSYQRALRLAGEAPAPGPAIDTEALLGDLVLSADAEARADLRDRVLAPLAEFRPTARAKLAETLLVWLLHLGRRDAVAEALFVHPQTVRYRVSQLREAYGDRLDDPAWIRDAIVALG